MFVVDVSWHESPRKTDKCLVGIVLLTQENKFITYSIS